MRHRITQLLAALGLNSTTYYCTNCAGHYPASHFPCG